MSKSYTFIVEKIYRNCVEVEVDLDKYRKEERFQCYTDEEILIDLSDELGCFDARNDWSLEENNVRTIYETESKETIYED